MAFGKELSIEEQKRISLDILIQFAEFCEKNNLRYFLAYGTLLGAVRHKGFIPWDDDIDVKMPRPDYDKFIELWNKNNEKYLLVTLLDKNGCYPFGKLYDTNTVKIENSYEYHDDYRGVELDVFPLDGSPDTLKEFQKHYKKIRFLLKILLYHFCKINSRKLTKILCPIVRTFVDKKKLSKRIDKLMHKYPYDTSKTVGVTTVNPISVKDRHRKECYDNYVLLDFEGYKFRAPIGYDETLTDFFGDYMQLPPEEKRVSHHNHKCYYKAD